MTELFNPQIDPTAPSFAASLLDAPVLTEAEKDEAILLLQQLGRISPMNKERTLWYEAKHAVEHLGIAVPPQLERVAPVLGWPARAVDDLAERVIFDGCVAPGNAWESLGMNEIWSGNKLPILSTQTHTSAFKYSVSFVAALSGGVGELPVILRAYSATTSTGRWDPLHSRLRSFLTLTDRDALGRISGFVLFTDEAILRCTWSGKDWAVERQMHPAGRPPVVALVNNPSVENEFGTSRITRPVMSITQRAVRTLLRMEVSAEFYSSPQRAVLGAQESDFVDSATGLMKTGWEVTIGKLLALSRDAETDQLPQVHQFQQASMQPHVEMVRADAALLSGETGIPVDTLGVIHDNPASASGVDARYKKLNAAASWANLTFGAAWADLMRLAVIMRDGDPRAADSLSQLEANMRPPHVASMGEASDAIVKQVAAIPWIAETTVALRRLGYSKAEIDEMLSERRRGEASSRIAQLIEASKVVTNGNSSAGDGVPAGEPVAGVTGTA